MSIFKKKETVKEIKKVKLSKVGVRPTDTEAENFNPLSKEMPEHIRQIDNQLILDIVDRLYGPDGIKYENMIKELNKDFEPRKGKFGNQFYDEDFVREKHPNGIIFGKIIKN